MTARKLKHPMTEYCPWDRHRIGVFFTPDAHVGGIAPYPGVCVVAMNLCSLDQSIR